MDHIWNTYGTYMEYQYHHSDIMKTSWHHLPIRGLKSLKSLEFEVWRLKGLKVERWELINLNYYGSADRDSSQ